MLYRPVLRENKLKERNKELEKDNEDGPRQVEEKYAERAEETENVADNNAQVAVRISYSIYVYYELYSAYIAVSQPMFCMVQIGLKMKLSSILTHK